MRRPHFIKPNHGLESPQAAVWFDTETHERRRGKSKVEHVLDFGWACFKQKRSDGKWTQGEWLRFETRSMFWTWLCGKTRQGVRLYAFCHNTNFDLPVLNVFKELPRRKWKLLTCVIDAPPTILKFRRDRATIQILDTLNFWRMPLKILGEHVGLQKLEMPARGASQDEWDTYAKRDVEIIVKACIEWWAWLAEGDYGGFASTLAGQSMRTFRHKYMRHKIFIEAQPLGLAISRAAYQGGRTECFRLGHYRQPMYLLDVNSMYPFAMRGRKFPCVVRGATRSASLTDLDRWSIDGALCAQVVLETSEPAYPVRLNNKLCFPVGTFTTSLSTPEIRHALDAGHIKEVLSAVVYTAEPLFDEFIEDMYAKRIAAKETGNDTLSWHYKILLNSFYGKWGQKGIVWEREKNSNDLSAAKWLEYDAETGTVTKWRQLGGIVQRQAREVESRESFPAIAAHVTAYARLHLWKLIQRAGIENVFTVDTDSLFVNQTGYDNLKSLIHPTELGALKLERFESEGVFYGLKDYRFGEKVKCKGVKSKALWVAWDEVEQDQWSSLKGLLAQGRMFAPSTARRPKTLHRVYDKGTVAEDGSISPLVLDCEGSGAAPRVNVISRA